MSLIGPREEVFAMNEKTPTDSLVTRRILSFGIAAYLTLWAAAFAFLSRVFGNFCAGFLSLVLAVPVVIALRMRWRQQAVQEKRSHTSCCC